jgi:hypothetical protein
MERKVITANGNYKFSCPLGRSFTIAASGAFDSAVLTAQYNSGMDDTDSDPDTPDVDVWKPFATTAISLNAAGEKTGINVGAHNEINVSVASAGGSAAVVVVFNVLPI